MRIRQLIKTIIIYLIVFIAALMIFGMVLNQGKVSGTLQDSQAGLPVIYVRTGGQNINEMHGYVADVDAGYYRDTLTPVTDSKTINLNIEEHDKTVKSAAYELYNDQYTDLIESGDCQDLEKNDAMLQMKIEFGTSLRSNCEYVLRIILTDSAEEEISYYTRVRYGSDLKIAEKLDFVLDFNEATFDKNNESSIGSYLDSTSSGTSDMSEVNLSSSSDAVTWGEIAPNRTSDIAISLKEVNTETAAFTLDYSVESETDGVTLVYDVQEFYRLKWTSDQIYLLDFEREMTQDISQTDVSLSSGAICLGIGQSKDIDYEGYGTDDQSYGYFRIGSELWLYDVTSSILTKVYDASDDDHDCSGNTQIGIRVMRCDPDTGDLYFIVYGYMHEGDYEGREGIMVCHFSHEDVSLEELMFIPYDKGFQELQSSVEKLAYMNESEIYLMIEDTIYRIEPDLGRIETAWSGLDSSICAVSSEGMLVMADELDSSGKCGRSLKLIDLNTDSESSLSGDGSMIRPLGYIGDDLVYGLIDADKIHEDSTGVVQTPISEIRIVDADMNEIRSYTKSGSYIKDVTISEDSMEIELEKAVGNGDYTDYEEAGSDYIISNMADDSASVTLTSKKDTVKGYQNWLQFASSSTLNPITQTARDMDPGYDITKELEFNDEVEICYYVYSGGELAKTFRSLAEAIEFGNSTDAGATIMSSHKQIIWQKAGRAYVWDLGIESIDQTSTQKAMKKALISTIASYEDWTVPDDMDWNKTVFGCLTEAAGAKADTVDLTGIALTEVLHFVYRDRAVIAKIGSDKFGLIVGYDDNNDYVAIADPSTGEITYLTESEAEETFEKYGSIFYSYLD